MPDFNQVTVATTDYAASVDFYRTIGLAQIVAAAPRYARFESDSGSTFSIEASDELPTGPVFYFECADLDATIARLRASGVTVGDPRDESWGWREARTRDPAGNAICLYQAGEMRRFPPWRLPDA